MQSSDNKKKMANTKVLILGDTFDRRKYVNFYSLQRAKKMFFDELAKRNMDVYMLVGNHDTYYKNTNEVNSVSLLINDYNNIHVIDSPTTIDLGEEKVCMIPWICADNYTQCVKEINNTSASICAGHFEIEGFAMYKGLPSQEGLSRGLFNRFEYTFSGHYHHKSNADGIYYLGNPYELTWQDYNDTRGFHLMDFWKNEIEFIPNRNRMFHKILYDDKVNTIKEIDGLDLSIYKNTYVKVVVINKTNPFFGPASKKTVNERLSPSDQCLSVISFPERLNQAISFRSVPKSMRPVKKSEVISER